MTHLLRIFRNFSKSRFLRQLLSGMSCECVMWTSMMWKQSMCSCTTPIWNICETQSNKDGTYMAMATEHIICIYQYMAYKVLWNWRKTCRFQHVHFSFVTRLVWVLASWRWRCCHFRHRRVVCYKSCHMILFTSLLLTGRGSPSPKICLLRT